MGGRESRETRERRDRLYFERRPETRKAHDAVKYALRTGRLRKGPCEREGSDCKGPVQAHHDDHFQPLAVRWLCQRHHRQAESRPRTNEHIRRHWLKKAGVRPLGVEPRT